MNRSAWSLLVVATVSSVVLLTNLGGPRLWDRDEPRNASCAAEMLTRDDWVTPVMNAELRTHKPIMLYWVTMAFYSVGGVNEFTARLGSALAAIGSVLLTYAMGYRLFDRTAAFWSALALATMLMFNVAARAATPDSLLIFFIVATLTAFIFALPVNSESPRSRLPIGMASLMYLASAGAVLTKGPVGLILPLAVAGAYLMARSYPFASDDVAGWTARARRAWSLIKQTPFRFGVALWDLRPLLGLAIVLAVAAPWYLWVGIRTQGHWLSGFFLEHNLSRFNDSMEGHSGSIFYYPVALLVGSFPWSALLIPICLLLRQSWPSQQRRGLMFCLCWIGVIVGLFSLAQTKLPSYVTPCYPAMALLVGWFISRLGEPAAEMSRKWMVASAGVLTLAGLGMAIGLPIAASIYAPQDLWLGVLGASPLLGGMFLIYSLRNQLNWAAPVLAVTAATMMLGFFAVAADRLDSYRQHEQLFGAIGAKNKQVPVAAWGVLEPSWVFYSRRPLEVVESEPRTHRVVEASDRKWREEIVDTPRGFLERHPGGVLVTTRAQWERQQSEYQNELVEVADAPYFLKNDDLVALQSRSALAQQKANPRR